MNLLTWLDIALVKLGMGSATKKTQMFEMVGASSHWSIHSSISGVEIPTRQIQAAVCTSQAIEDDCAFCEPKPFAHFA